MVDWWQERNGNCSVRSICNRQDFLEAELAFSSWAVWRLEYRTLESGEVDMYVVGYILEFRKPFVTTHCSCHPVIGLWFVSVHHSSLILMWRLIHVSNQKHTDLHQVKTVRLEPAVWRFTRALMNLLSFNLSDELFQIAQGTVWELECLHVKTSGDDRHQA